MYYGTATTAKDALIAGNEGARTPRMLLQHSKQAELGCHVRGPGALEGVVDGLEAGRVRGRRGPEVGDGREAQPPARCVWHDGPPPRFARGPAAPPAARPWSRRCGGGAEMAGRGQRQGGGGARRGVGSARRGVTVAIPGPSWVPWALYPGQLGWDSNRYPTQGSWVPSWGPAGREPADYGRALSCSCWSHPLSLSLSVA